MEAFYSSSAGVLVFPALRAGKTKFIDFILDVEIQEHEFLQSFSLVDDWEHIDSKSENIILETAYQEFWNERAKSLFIDSLVLDNEGLILEILDRINDILAEQAETNKVLDKLLIAPLKSIISVSRIHDLSLSNGYVAVAAVANSLIELQPHINRFINVWLNVNPINFINISIDKPDLLKSIVNNTNFSQLISSDSYEHFQKAWGTIIFQIKSVQDRAGITTLGSILAKMLHLNNAEPINDLLTNIAEFDSFGSDNLSNNKLDIHSTFQRVQHQINAVIDSIKIGHDTKANKIIRELVDYQNSFPEGEEFIVKSLCNIAKKSSELLRYDFEKKCLSSALNINPKDGWTLVQYADHLKRTGDLDSALNIVRDTQQIYQNDVVYSLEADIFSELGKYEKALDIYRSIDNWDRKHRVVNAVADVYRRIGEHETAEKLYNRILNNDSFIDEFDDYYRAHVGLAEIKKQKGLLDDAYIYYNKIINSSNNDLDKYFYRLGICNVLKLKGDYIESFKFNDDNISTFPFATQPKLIRTTLLSLLSKNDEAISYLLSVGNSIFQEWLFNYYQGLMLLKLEKNSEAKEKLVDNIVNLDISSDEKVLLRFGATLSSLSVKDTLGASNFLSETDSVSSYYHKYLQLVLKLHLASLEQDNHKHARILSKIKSLTIDDIDISAAIYAITKKDYNAAISHETNFLLKLVA